MRKPTGGAAATAVWAAVVFAAVPVAEPALAQTPYHPLPPGLRCPGDQIVWLNTRTGVFHFRGERYFGSTKSGKYICERQALAEGDRATENGQ